MKSISEGPHYEVASRTLADWLEAQGLDLWWSVDGDPLLTGNIPFPATSDELAAELRRIDKSLLVQAKPTDPAANGDRLRVTEMDKVVDRFKRNMRLLGETPDWANDRVLYACWKGSPHEWLLIEDSATRRMYEAEELAATT